MKSILFWLFCFITNGAMLLAFVIKKCPFNQEPLVYFLGFTIPTWSAYSFYIFTTFISVCWLITAIDEFYKKK